MPDVIVFKEGGYRYIRAGFQFSSGVAAEADSRRGSFVIAGGAEVRGGPEGYAARTVRYGYTSADALREKLRFVVDLMEQRLKALGFSWQDAVSTQAYTVHDIGALVGSE